MKGLHAALPLLFALPVSLPVLAAWELDPGRSQVEATVTEITPNGEVPHRHHVRELSGDISADGTLSLPLRLDQTDVIERLGELPPWLSGLARMPLVTLQTQLPPERLEGLDIGESLTETLEFRISAENATHREPIALRFTRRGLDTVHVTTAEEVSIEGQELMANQTARTVMLLLGYEQIGDEVPVELDVTLINR